ncbi:hypothetical protein ACHAPW_007682 [Verticillium nonalfalfae]
METWNNRLIDDPLSVAMRYESDTCSRLGRQMLCLAKVCKAIPRRPGTRKQFNYFGDTDSNDKSLVPKYIEGVDNHVEEVTMKMLGTDSSTPAKSRRQVAMDIRRNIIPLAIYTVELVFLAGASAVGVGRLNAIPEHAEHTSQTLQLLRRVLVWVGRLERAAAEEFASASNRQQDMGPDASPLMLDRHGLDVMIQKLQKAVGDSYTALNKQIDKVNRPIIRQESHSDELAEANLQNTQRGESRQAKRKRKDDEKQAAREEAKRRCIESVIRFTEGPTRDTRRPAHRSVAKLLAKRGGSNEHYHPLEVPQRVPTAPGTSGRAYPDEVFKRVLRALKYSQKPDVETIAESMKYHVEDVWDVIALLKRAAEAQQRAGGNWWRFYDVWGQRPENTHIALHKKHGDVVRLGPNTLSFADPAALKTIYGLNKGFVKSDFYIVQQSIVQGNRLQSLFSTTDNGFHSQFRRCVNSAFSMSALVQYEPFVDNTTKLFLDQTEKFFAGKPEGCDFTRWLQFYAFDVIGEITYSKRHGFVEKNEDIDGIVDYLGKLFLYVAPVGQIPFLDLLLLKNPVYLKLSQWGLIDSTFPVARFARARMSERLPALLDQEKPLLPVTAAAKQKQQPDLLSKFLAARESRPEFMSDTLVQTMAVSMAFAGSETTAITLSAVFYYLLRTPAALASLRSEIDEAARKGKFEDTTTGLVTWNEARELEYLDACVNEAFRLHPAPGLPLERIVPPGGAEIAGVFVPGGTIVGCNAWVIHRNKAVFGDDVEVYRPERWLIGQGRNPAELSKEELEFEDRRVKEMKGTMLQFGMGSRTCIGKNISLLEIYKVVPSLLRRFEINFQDPSRDWEIVNAWFVKQNNFWVTFDKRDIVQPVAA